MKYIFFLVAVAAFFTSGCSSFKSKDVSLIVDTTPGQVSEFKNSVKVSTDQATVRVASDKYHVIYKVIRTKGLDRAFNWIGVGVHTRMGTDISYYHDAYSDDFWMLDVTNTRTVRGKLSTIFGFYHFDRYGGDLINSGGARTTMVRIGVKYHLNKRLFARIMYEAGNQGAAYIEDRLLTGIGLNL